MKSKKMASVVIASVLFLGMSMGAYAASNVKEIKAFLQGDVKFTFNGDSWKPKDEKGNQVIPISYQGTTYVPIKAVTDALNVPLDYDVNKKTYNIGEKSDGVTLYSKSITIDSSGRDIIDKKQLVFDGKQYNGAYAMYAGFTGSNLNFNLGKSYSKMHLVLVAKSDMEIKVFNENSQELTGLINLKKDEVTEIDLDLMNAKQFRIKAWIDNNDSVSLLVLKDSFVK